MEFVINLGVTGKVRVSLLTFLVKPREILQNTNITKLKVWEPGLHKKRNLSSKIVELELWNVELFMELEEVYPLATQECLKNQLCYNDQNCVNTRT